MRFFRKFTNNFRTIPNKLFIVQFILSIQSLLLPRLGGKARRAQWRSATHPGLDELAALLADVEVLQLHLRGHVRRLADDLRHESAVKLINIHRGELTTQPLEPHTVSAEFSRIAEIDYGRSCL